MAEQPQSRKTVARGAIILIVMVAAVALLAAPAMAVQHATSLQATAASPMVTYGGGTMITATLRDTDAGNAAIGGEWVRVEQSPDGGNPWALLYLVTSATGPYATGEYSAAVLPLQTTSYRFVYEGSSSYFAMTSNNLTIAVKPALGKPTCPSKIKKNKQFTVKGSINPGAPTGPTVKIKAYRLKSGSWVSYKTYTATVSGTTASATIKITHTGKFKFKTSTAESASFASAVSSYSSQLRVTK